MPRYPDAQYHAYSGALLCYLYNCLLVPQPHLPSPQTSSPLPQTQTQDDAHGYSDAETWHVCSSPLCIKNEESPSDCMVVDHTPEIFIKQEYNDDAVGPPPASQATTHQTQK